MIKHLIAVLVLAGIAQAQVILTPGTSSWLNQVAGSGYGNAGVAYQGDAVTVNTAALSVPPGTSGWLVGAGSDTLLQPLNQTGLIWSRAFTVGGQVQLNVWYYLSTGDGGQQGANASSLNNEYFRSQSFMLVPEPGTYALVAGLGLVSFAAWRRFRR